ncbi:hypothetical protein N5A93_16435 [Roseovarius sp. EGI FJ00037]|uniref:hypothetical protein n=1 Tax=Roseovarius salincola TaxID=2978479 RepID=UPI0022A8BF37|nr:hypothetical protein [Roseovarius sp. EGI FJ00037]MCZ0813818.1 hypothetical protein [Roseovarius sp. EGI FJ00037]
MADYIVTESNWNDLLFWQSVAESTTGNSLDFSGLGAGFDVVIDQATGIISISDGSTVLSPYRMVRPSSRWAKPG